MGIPTSIENLTHEVLTLEPDAQLQLAHTLAVSLSRLSRAQFDELWLAEATRRDEEMESGEIKGISGEEVFAQIESQYQK